MRPKTEIAARGALRIAAFGLAASFAFSLTAATSALALSEIKREEIPAPATPSTPTTDGEAAPENSVPIPDPIQTPPAANAPAGTEEAPEDQPAEPQDGTPTEPDATGPATPHLDPDGPLPEIVYDLSRLPEPVARMRNLLVEAAKTGDIEKLRPLIGQGDAMPQLSFGEIEGDPIAFIKSLSGDGEGQELLAIMEEVLNAGYVHLGEGTDEDLYVWPYFFGIPLDKLDARQKVELFKIVTAGDYEDMKQYGTYVFYRLGITPDGRWAFFVAGD
ncbi:hypothetical protein ACFFTN_05070 [Aminobacter aganoensis]|uniref:Fibronectin attachment protein n=1 Tax=Aminobacter aganoensis TaxID=83264 RepID=A0A7X0KJM7_9HYPH|nr:MULTISPECIES: hypothetical protein [Aminobacter]KQU65666.1 hypothetical protein ASC75_10620 [Aminobacter sp. DSM 101952]MBB6353293.1 hypothetical protein [Aminobacter aganoensis]